MADTTINDLDAITARADGATAGPWTARTTGVAGGDHWYICDPGEAVAYVSASDGENEEQREPDAEFIAHSREDVPALVAEVRALRAERDSYRDNAQAWRRYMAQQASVDNATPPRFATGGIVRHPQPFDAARTWAELHPAPTTNTTALAEDREADPTDDCD